MKVKRLLKFYFCADGLDGALNNLIMRRALNLECSALAAAEGICDLLEEKSELSRLWGYMNRVMAGMPRGEAETLKSYALLRTGFSRLTEDMRKEYKRVTVKYFRRARNVVRYEKAIELINKYYCLISVSSCR